MSYRLKTITREEHLAFIRDRPSVSHMQVPSWGDVKPDWRAESMGWFDERGRLVGAGLVLFRPVPKLKRYLAYLPEGPAIDWYAADLALWLEPMLAHLKSQGAFSVKMGPPVVGRRWDAETVKAAIADPAARRLRRRRGRPPRTRAPPRSPTGCAGWAGAGAPTAARTASAPASRATSSRSRSRDGRWRTSSRDFNQQWRRNIKKAEKAGVKVVRGDYDELPVFYELYARDRASATGSCRAPWPYFQRMWTALEAEDPDRMRLYLAHHEGEVLAAATMLTVGEHVWYSYGASTSRKREVQPNNAIQWRMMSDAHAAGAGVYDFRGITDTLDESNHLLGLLRFKAGTGGRPPSTSASGTSRSTRSCTRRSSCTWPVAEHEPPPDTPAGAAGPTEGQGGRFTPASAGTRPAPASSRSGRAAATATARSAAPAAAAG